MHEAGIRLDCLQGCEFLLENINMGKLSEKEVTLRNGLRPHSHFHRERTWSESCRNILHGSGSLKFLSRE
jgi:hypothetical protein